MLNALKSADWEQLGKAAPCQLVLSPKFVPRCCMCPANEQTLEPTPLPPPVQAGGEGVDRGAAARDLPPLLRPRGDAHLCRQHGRAVQLEQEGVRHGAGQLLLGLLLHPSVRRLRQ